VKPLAPSWSWSWVPTSFCLRGTDLFVGTDNFPINDTGAGFRIFDVSDPAAPVGVSSVQGWDDVQDVDADDEHLYGVGTSMSYGYELFIYDVTDLSSPVRLSSLNISLFPWALEVRRDLAYVAAWGSGLVIVDVSDRTAPEIVGSWGAGSKATDVVLSGPYAFVADPDSGLTVVAVVRPDAPTPVARLPLPGSPRYLTLGGDYLIVGGNASPGVSVVDVSDPTAPVAVAQYASGGFSRAAVLDTVVIGITQPTSSLEMLGAGFLGETEVAVDANIPAPFALRAYPNPFGTAATVEFELPRAMAAEVTVFDAAGRAVRALRRGVQASGTNRIEWDGRDDAGRRVASGVYFVRVRAEVGTVSRKLVTLK
jgi:hypothetical protein